MHMNRTENGFYVPMYVPLSNSFRGHSHAHKMGLVPALRPVKYELTVCF